MAYRYDTLQDLLQNDTFTTWVRRPTPVTDQFWHDWQQEKPSRQELLQEARSMVLSVHFEEEQLSDQRIAALWARLQRSHQDIHPPRRPAGGFVRLRHAAVLAGFILTALLSVWLMETFSDEVTHRTAYGETQMIVLPDLSTVQLNANSILTHARSWEEEQDRQVVLAGEAFFSVKHTADNRKFSVQTGSVTVEVLGTEFNVQHRRAKTQVVLKEGKVRLRYGNNKHQQRVSMSPGELAVVYQNEYTVQRVNTQYHTAWTDDVLLFEKVTVAEIAQQLEDFYGLEVELQDTTLAQRRFTGTAPADSVGNLLGQLEKVFGLTVARSGSRIILK